MTKKYSSYDKQMLLCETFRKFVLKEGSWGDENLDSSATNWKSRNWKDAERNAGVSSRRSSALTPEQNGEVLNLVLDFLEGEGRKLEEEGLIDELIAQTRISYMDSEEGSWSERMHSSDLYDRVDEKHGSGAPGIVRSVLENLKNDLY